MTTAAIALNFTNRNGIPVMSSPELAELCVGTSKDAHSDFLKKAKKVLGAVAFGNFSERETYGNNNTRNVLMLPEREACLMAMSYSYELQAYVYDEWQKLKQANALPDFNNPVLAARAWADEVEAKQEALAIIEEQKPKVEYHDTVLSAINGMTITTIAKELGMTGRRLNKELHDLGIQYKSGKQWLLYAEHDNKGWITVETHTYVDANTGENKTSHTTLWTEEGRRAIHNLMT